MFRDYLCAIEFPPVRSNREEPNAAANVVGGPGPGDDDILMTCSNNDDPTVGGVALVEHMFGSLGENNINIASQRSVNEAGHTTPVQDGTPFPELISQGE